jgi:hypothetical protein
MVPDWLPGLLVTDGDWDTVVTSLYAVFCRDFKHDGPRLNGLPVSWDDRILDGPYEEAFWHLITGNDPKTGQRLFEPDRSKRLAWCGAVIRNADDAAVLQWVYREKGQLRTYVWLKDFDYVVVLKGVPSSAPGYYFLITGFHLTGDSQRRNMRRRYERRVA